MASDHSIDPLVQQAYLQTFQAVWASNGSEDASQQFLRSHTQAWAEAVVGGFVSDAHDVRLEGVLLEQGLKVAFAGDLREPAAHVASAMLTCYLNWVDGRTPSHFELTPLTQRIGSELCLALPVAVPSFVDFSLPRAEQWHIEDEWVDWSRFGLTPHSSPGCGLRPLRAPKPAEREVTFSVGTFFPADWSTYVAFGRASVVGTWAVTTSSETPGRRLEFVDRKDGVYAEIDRDDITGARLVRRNLLAAVEVQTRDAHPFIVTGPRRSVRRVFDELGLGL